MNDQERLLTIFLRLQSGAHLTKSQLADEFGVSEKTIQRDFSLLGSFMETQPMIAAELAYDTKHYSRFFKGKSLFNKKDILTISKILLENRALNTEENKTLLDGLLALVPKTEQKEISSIIASELLNYTPLSDTQDRIDKIWDWSEAIRKATVRDIVYQSPYTNKQKKHSILPVSLYYDSRYFYLVAYHLKHENYMTLKLDRILSWEDSKQPKPSIPHKAKFRDGDIRSQHVDAFLGETISFDMAFKYDPSIVLDQFPLAKITGGKDEWTQFRIDSQYTPGLKRWILSQGEAVKVLSPQYLIDDLTETIQKMLDKYE